MDATDPGWDEPSSWRSRLLPAVMALLLLVVLALTATLAVERLRGDDGPVAATPVDVGPKGAPGSSPGAEAVRAARAGALDYFSLDHRDVDGALARMKRIATPTFNRLYAAKVDQQRAQVRAQRAVLSATLPTSGTATEYLSDTAAMVLVSVDVRRRSTAGGDVSRTATRVTLQRADDRWLVSGIDELGAQS